MADQHNQTRDELADKFKAAYITATGGRTHTERSDWYPEADDMLAWLAEHTRTAVDEALAEAAPLIRRAINDPGSFVKRGPDYDGEPYGEPLDQWQARAIEAAVAGVREARARGGDNRA